MTRCCTGNIATSAIDRDVMFFGLLLLWLQAGGTGLIHGIVR